MSDHGHHDPGGHELEAIDTSVLFKLFIALSLITLLASYAVVQWFYLQRSELEGRYAAEGSFMLQNHKAKMAEELEGIDRVVSDVAANPALLAAPAPPSGWVHPDDLVGGGAAEATPAAHAPEHAPVEVAKPEVAEPVEGEAAEGEAAEGEAAEGEAAEVAKPEADKPEADKPEADKPKADKPKVDKPEADKPKADKPAKPAQDEPKPAKPADSGE